MIQWLELNGFKDHSHRFLDQVAFLQVFFQQEEDQLSPDRDWFCYVMHVYESITIARCTSSFVAMAIKGRIKMLIQYHDDG